MIGEDFGIMRKGSRHTHACCIKSTSPAPHPSPLLLNISRAFAPASVASIADQSLPSISRTAFSRKHSRPIPPQHIVLISLLFFSLLLSWLLVVSSSSSREAGGKGEKGGILSLCSLLVRPLFPLVVEVQGEEKQTIRHL